MHDAWAPDHVLCRMQAFAAQNVRAPLQLCPSDAPRPPVQIGNKSNVLTCDTLMPAVVLILQARLQFPVYADADETRAHAEYPHSPGEPV